ncbi:cadherin repeat domain-containing protein, partial [Aliivibrio sp. 1S128]|uniref:cadherin repeat domain-containing protein n=1 Tax=Aliivibrio sp. 1S128 TaxID=1840085 RepID=UPI00080EE19E
NSLCHYTKLDNYSGKGLITIKLNTGENLSFNLSSILIQAEVEQNEITFILDSLVDVTKSDNTDILNILSTSEGTISINIDGSFKVDGIKHEFKYINNQLEKDAYKSAFEILKFKNEELYMPEGDVSKPIFEITDSFNTTALDYKEIQIETIETYYAELSYHVSGANFVTVDKNGLIKIKPTLNDIGLHKVTVYVWNTAEKDKNHSQEITFNVGEKPNTAPVIEQISGFSMKANTVQTIQTIAIDYDKDNLTYSIESLLNFSTINPETGLITLEPTIDHLNKGTDQITVTVTDGDLTDTALFNVNVKDPSIPQPEDNHKPILESIENIELNSGVIHTIQIIATDENKDNLFYTVSGVEWVSVDALGLISITPPIDISTGNYIINYSVSDNKSEPVSNSFSVIINKGSHIPTLSEFLTLIGETSESIGVLFDPRTGISWDISEDGKPLLLITSPYGDYFMFNPFDEVVTFGIYNKEINNLTELSFPNEVKTIRMGGGSYEQLYLDNVPIVLINTEKHLDLLVETTLTKEVLEFMLLGRHNTSYFIIEAHNIHGYSETIEFQARTSLTAEHMRSRLHQILSKFIR